MALDRAIDVALSKDVHWFHRRIAIWIAESWALLIVGNVVECGSRSLWSRFCCCASYELFVENGIEVIQDYCFYNSGAPPKVISSRLELHWFIVGLPNSNDNNNKVLLFALLVLRASSIAFLLPAIDFNNNTSCDSSTGISPLHRRHSSC